MNIKTLPVGSYQANCYLLQEGEHLAIIDPGAEPEKIAQAIKETGGNLEYILLTHGHFDHTGGVEELKNAFPSAKVCIHEGDSRGAGSQMLDLKSAISDLHCFEDGEKLPFGALNFTVVATSGHSKGSVCLQIEDHLFTGDTLFFGSMGRTDLMGGNYEEIMVSLRKLSELDGDFNVYPGHDRSSTLNHERKLNPFVQEAMNG